MLALISAKVMLILQYSGMSKFCRISAKNVSQCSWVSPKSWTIETDSEPSFGQRFIFGKVVAVVVVVKAVDPKMVAVRESEVLILTDEPIRS